MRVVFSAFVSNPLGRRFVVAFSPSRAAQFPVRRGCQDCQGS